MTDGARSTVALPADERGPVAGSALVAAAAGVLAVALLALPAVAAALGVVAVAGALHSRSQLRADPALRGARPSALGAILGGVALLCVAYPFVLDAALRAFAG